MSKTIINPEDLDDRARAALKAAFEAGDLDALPDLKLASPGPKRRFPGYDPWDSDYAAWLESAKRGAE